MPGTQTTSASVGLARSERGELRFLTCGSVDDGKSTLVGRLIASSAGLLDDQLESLRTDSRRFGTTNDEIDFALLVDGLEAEREQAITIDVAYRFFATRKRAFIVADTPGHHHYTRNMATGASNAELAVLLVDASKGLVEQTRRHAAIVSLLGIRDVVLAINKMDLVKFSATRFHEIEAAFAQFARPLGFRSIMPIPLSARFGDNIVTPSERTPWFEGPSLLTHLETVETGQELSEAPLRFPVQWVNRPNSLFRGFAGTVASGKVSVGDEIVVALSGRTSRIDRIVTFDGDLSIAFAGRSVTLTFLEEIDIGRGDLLADPKNRPLVTRRFSADLIWMDETEIMAGARFLMKIGTATQPATLKRIVGVLDLETLSVGPTDRLRLNMISRVEIETDSPVALDPYSGNRQTGGFVLINRSTQGTAAAGMALHSLDRANNVYRQAGDISPAVRAAQKGQRPLVIWLTGLPSSGKSTIANLVERKLVALGRHTMLLDGDNLRLGLNVDLGFSASERSENVRRVGEMAKLMADAGLIVIVALVSPFTADRNRAASLMAEGQFLEILVETPIEVCRQRDTKGLYAKATRGKISDVTGLDQAYEVPMQPELVLATLELTPDEAADRVVTLVLDRLD